MQSPTRVTLVSPHQDDAVFSLGCWIVRWSKSNVAVTVVNCFTRSTHSPFIACKEGLDVPLMRAQEDERSLRSLHPSISIVNLALWDAPIRIGCDIADVCDPAKTQGWDGEIVETIGAALPSASLTLFPLAFGSHIDHRHVHDVSFSRHVFEVGYYEDLPYAARASPGCQRACLEKVASTWQSSYVFELESDSIAEKETAAALYRSQIDAHGLSEIVDYTRALGGERIWLPSTSHDSY